MPMHTCPTCGTNFKHRKSARTYCSMDCRNAMYRQRGTDHPGTRQVGSVPSNKAPVGTVTVRTRWNRGNDTRAWVKVAEPNVWRPLAVQLWESAHGPVPVGSVIHHVDHDSLNDDPSNLVCMTRAAHVEHHRVDFEAKRAAAAVAARWGVVA